MPEKMLEILFQRLVAPVDARKLTSAGRHIRCGSLFGGSPPLVSIEYLFSSLVVFFRALRALCTIFLPRIFRVSLALRWYTWFLVPWFL